MGVADYSWYHCIDLPDGTQTPGQKVILQIQRPIMAELHRHDLLGKRVLDIGCRDDYFRLSAGEWAHRKLLASTTIFRWVQPNS